MNYTEIFKLIGSTAGIATPILITTIYWLMRHDAVRNAHREVTQQVYKEWWSDELSEYRRYLFREFVPLHREKLLGKNIKEIETIIPEDHGRIRKLCYFFERVGWLGAAGLIDVDYILGPMQHCVRSTWIALEPFIMKERNPGNGIQPDSVHHSVYLSGFEWLYKRSMKKHQADLIRNKFKRPRLRSVEEIQALRNFIDIDEDNFMNQLEVQNRTIVGKTPDYF